MDIRKIKKLIELLEESSLTEIEIVEGEESVRLSRGGMAHTARCSRACPRGAGGCLVGPAAVPAAPAAVQRRQPSRGRDSAGG